MCRETPRTFAFKAVAAVRGFDDRRGNVAFRNHNVSGNEDVPILRIPKHVSGSDSFATHVLHVDVFTRCNDEHFQVDGELRCHCDVNVVLFQIVT